jgi:hypothetical protein
MNWKLDLLTQFGTTSNHSSIASFHTLQITTALVKRFPDCVLNGSSLATVSNSGDSSATRAQDLLSQSPLQSSCQFSQLPSAKNLVVIYSELLPQSKSKSTLKLLYDWRFTADQFVLASSSLRLTTRDFFN